MSHDTPGAVPSDDFPFLGPAVSPRRREGGAPAPDADELAGPFVGGTYRSSPADEAGGAEEEAGSALAGFDEAFAGAAAAGAEEDEMEGLPAAEWPEDDFPWLVPSEAQETGGAPETVGEREGGGGWRATGEVEELAEPEAEAAGAGPAGQGVDHFSWIGERLPQEGAGEAWEDEGAGAGAGAVAEGEDETGTFPWDEARAEDEAERFGAGGGELGGFESVSEGGESWGAEWSPEPSGAEGALERTAEPWAEEGSAEVAGAAFDWGDSAGDAADAAPKGEDRWGAAGFQVEDEGSVEGVAGWAEEGEGGAGAAASAAAAEVGAPGGEAPVEATPLPVGEWETAPDEGEVQEEAQAVAAGDPLLEVAERLERIARSLRSGKPIEAVEEGDPLQLLITGYALGYSQARRAGR